MILKNSFLVFLFSIIFLFENIFPQVDVPFNDPTTSEYPIDSDTPFKHHDIPSPNSFITDEPIEIPPTTTDDVIPPSSVNIQSGLMASNGQWASTYLGHDNFMLDQERGTYVMETYYTSKWSSISMSTINGWKNKYYNTLVLLLIVLDNYRSSDISDATLTKIHNEFQIYRSAGVKTIIRFIYNDNMGSKPWGDASSPSVVFRHIDQLQPLLRINEDVIAYVQGGFVGLWGEWYYTDSFGDEGKYTAQNKADRKTVISKLMTALPNRAVQIRTPYFMKQFYGSTPLAAASYTTELGRAAHHNDCFLADSTDMGTYDNYNSDYTYLTQQTKFTPTIFETCATSSRSTCTTALKEVPGLHMVSGHRLYNTAVWNQWISGGCYDTILKNMGHRLQLVSSSIDIQTVVASSFVVSVDVQNVGYAAPSNSRKTEIVLRNVDGSSYCVSTLNFDARSLAASSKTTIKSTIRLPANIPAGRYEVLLQFADPYTTLYAVPWYKIQAANSGIYEAGTGMHKLNAIIDVLTSGSPNAAQAGEVIATCGLSISALVNTTITSADSSCMSGYYKVGGICTMCPAGSACASATSTPVACTTGTYSSGGQTACTTCPSTCSGKGTCQVKTGACLCQTGFSGYDCSITSGSTPITTSPNTPTPTTKSPAPSTTSTPTTTKSPVTTTQSPSTTKSPVTPSTAAPPATTKAPVTPSTVAPATTKSPTSKSTCPSQKNLLVNPNFGSCRSTCSSWTEIGDGYDSVTRKNQPSIKLSVMHKDRVEGVSQIVKLVNPTSSTISFGAYVSSAYISGSPDSRFSLSLVVTYTDGTSDSKSVFLTTGSYGWQFKSFSFVPLKAVTQLEYRFILTGHTGYAYIAQPVLAVAPACSVQDSPIAFEGASVLVDDGSDTDLAPPDSDESSSTDSSTLIYALAAAGGAVFISVVVCIFMYYKRRQAKAVDTAIQKQMSSV